MIKTHDESAPKNTLGASAFSLKAIAMILMLCDHIVAVFGIGGWDVLPARAYLLRSVARLSFPIFAYFIVVGCEKTKDRSKYLFRLAVCALASQIPFSLTFYPTNLSTDPSSAQSIRCSFSPAIAIVAVVLTVAYLYFFRHREQRCRHALGVLAACLLPAVYLLDVSGIRVIGDDLNVLYTLALGALIIFELQDIRERSLRWWEHLLLIVAILLAVQVYGLPADYGSDLMGLILIVALYFGRRHKLVQSITIFAWGCYYYWYMYGSVYNAFGTLLAALLILLYNGESGPNNRYTKYLFYVFYPAHLLLIGLVNVSIKLL